MNVYRSFFLLLVTLSTVAFPRLVPLLSSQEVTACLREGFDKGETIEECHQNCKDRHIYCGAVWRSDEWQIRTCWQQCSFYRQRLEELTTP